MSLNKYSQPHCICMFCQDVCVPWCNICAINQVSVYYWGQQVTHGVHVFVNEGVLEIFLAGTRRRGVCGAERGREGWCFPLSCDDTTRLLKIIFIRGVLSQNHPVFPYYNFAILVCSAHTSIACLSVLKEGSLHVALPEVSTILSIGARYHGYKWSLFWACHIFILLHLLPFLSTAKIDLVYVTLHSLHGHIISHIHVRIVTLHGTGRQKLSAELVWMESLTWTYTRGLCTGDKIRSFPQAQTHIHMLQP